MQDSPVGVRFADYASVFSSGQSVAATFDRGLLYARGYAMGTEHKGKGVTVQLGPVAGPIGRSPEGGRNWEGFSPDPCRWYGGFLSGVSLTLLADLTGVGIAETIKGIQDAGIIACAKHFIGNEQVRYLRLKDTPGSQLIFAPRNISDNNQKPRGMVTISTRLSHPTLTTLPCMNSTSGHLQTQLEQVLDRSCALITKSTTHTLAKTRNFSTTF